MFTPVTLSDVDPLGRTVTDPPPFIKANFFQENWVYTIRTHPTVLPGQPAKWNLHHRNTTVSCPLCVRFPRPLTLLFMQEMDLGALSTLYLVGLAFEYIRCANPAAVGGHLFAIPWLTDAVGVVFDNIPDTPQSISTRFNVLFVSTLVLIPFPYLSVSHATADKVDFVAAERFLTKICALRYAISMIRVLDSIGRLSTISPKLPCNFRLS